MSEGDEEGTDRERKSEVREDRRKVSEGDEEGTTRERKSELDFKSRTEHLR